MPLETEFRACSSSEKEYSCAGCPEWKKKGRKGTEDEKEGEEEEEEEEVEEEGRRRFAAAKLAAERPA